MIRVAGEDLLGAVKLLQQHAARQKMRPGHRAKRQCRVGALEDFDAESICTADRKGKFGHTLVAPCREPLDRKSTRLNSSHRSLSRMPSSA